MLLVPLLLALPAPAHWVGGTFPTLSCSAEDLAEQLARLRNGDTSKFRDLIAAGEPAVEGVAAILPDGDGSLERADALQCWETAAVDKGVRRFPNGNYEVTVRAFDLKGNVGVRTARVRVQNP